jgi:toxin ParE1/3/4
MSSYKLSRLAENDLIRIWEYTVHEWSLHQAEKYLDGLLSSFEAIGDGKIKGKAIDQVRKGYQKSLYGKHYIFFRFSTENKAEIIRVLHVSMDVEKHL